MTETMNTGDVCRRLGLVITAELLLKLGFQPAGHDKRATLWAQTDYPAMCKKLGAHIAAQTGVPMQPKPEKKAKAPAAAAPTKGSTTPPDDDDEEL